MKQFAVLARNPHLWAIVSLTVLLSLTYYGDQLNAPEWFPLHSQFFSENYIHDLHRALFLLPMIYAPLVFRLKGAVVISAVTLFVVVPRAVFVSENPDPVLRPVIFIVLAGTASIVLGLERERRGKLADEVARRKLAEQAHMQLASIVTSSEDAILGETLEGIITSWNRGAENLYGYSASEVIGRHVSFLVPADVSDDVPRMLEKIGLGERVERYETIRVRKDGTRVPVSLTVSPIRDEEGRIVGASAIARDITQRKQAEEALKQSEENYARVVNAMQEILIVIDEKGQILFANHRAANNLNGGSPENVIGKNLADFVPPEYARDHIEHVRNVIQSGNAEAREIMMVLQGQPRGFRQRIIPIAYGTPNIPAALSMSLDITGRKMQEEALRASEEAYRRLFESTSDGIIVRDLDGNILMANSAMTNLTGYTPAELTGMNITRLLVPSSFEKVMEKQAHLIGKDIEVSSERYELQMIRKDGAERIVEAITSLLVGGGSATRVMATIRDVTEQKRARENIRAYVNQVIRAQEEERKRIARELHDETLQELATLGLELDLLARNDGTLSVGAVEELERIREKAGEIMDGIRRFTKDLRPPMLDELGLIEALQWLVDDLNMQRGINASFEVQGTPVRFSSDKELLLFRIAQEALSNVRKHSGASETVVKMAFTERQTTLMVKDNGQGFQLPDTISGFAQAGKLGLMGMQERVRLLGGTLTVKSEPGKGTTVTVTVET